MDSLTVGVGLLVVCCDSVLVFVEFGVELAHLVGTQSEVFLGASDFLVEIGILLQKGVHLLLQEVVLLVIGSDLILILAELLHEFGILVGAQSQVFLDTPHLSFHGGVLCDQTSDLLLQRADGFVHSVDLCKFLLQISEVDILLL